MKKNTLIIILFINAHFCFSQPNVQFKNPYNDGEKNVLLILFDDLRYDVFSFMGSHVQTPNIDELASEAVYFENACTTTGLCSPSRAALFTGKWGHKSGLDDNILLNTSRLTGLDMNQPTVLEWAREKNYFVGYFGKWHLGSDGPIRRGVHRWDNDGFEREKTTNYFSKPEAIDKFYDEEREFKEKPGYFKTIDGSYETHGSHKKVEDGKAFLQEVNTVKLPFFLTVSFNGPHPPYNVPVPYNKLYDPQEISLPQSFDDPFINKPIYQRWKMWYWHDVAHMSELDWKKTISYHDGFVSMLDKAVGELIESLKKEGYWENTMIILAGDQGSMLADHRLYDKGPYSYDELMRIPLLVRVPGHEGKKVTRHVSIMDINQTITDWLELEPGQDNLDSKSLLPLVKNGDDGWNTPDEAYYQYEWYNGTWFGIRTIRVPSYKFCFNPTAVSELYDLENDPYEIENVIDKKDFKNIQSELENRLLAHLLETEDPLYERLNKYLQSKRADEN